MAMMGARKEAILEVKDETGTVVEEIRALFTNRALADAELKLEKSTAVTVNGFMTGKSGVREIAVLLQAGMEAYRRSIKSNEPPVTYDDAFDVLDRIGVLPAANVIGPAVTAVLSYGKAESKEETSDEKNA